ncbi:MAG: DNA-processing protein DprA [Prevotellaceae bacterium]|nr:DNA-processing protein DprA [Prevotella sp.]MDD7258255.1 DNA-processing protein DprA [Prevotellaceae bacterium]MDY6129812.1 DNA-processing protein DprA [Prevotella sp.]
MTDRETLYTAALTRMNHFHLAGLLYLYREMGSATAVVENRHRLKELLPDASPRLMEGLAHIDEALKRAENELEYDEANGIQAIAMNDARYPARLRECDDAPLMLFYKGNADLNQRRIVSIVGTRHITAYGQDVTRRFVNDLKQLCPQVLIVSGMAYGVDINAHRSALDNSYETVAVLAHGLDCLYPPRHKPTAQQMLDRGGLLTEFFTQTNADKLNFVRRNRIVAGMSDACLLVESAAHGGGLITARLARDYHRDVFAFPGRIGDPYSEGCNRLIRDNGAALITSAHDFVKAMGWEEDAARLKAGREGIERQLFPQLSAEEQAVVAALGRQNDVQINRLAVLSNLPIGQLAALLFELEMKGVVKPLAGGVYHLLG